MSRTLCWQSIARAIVECVPSDRWAIICVRTRMRRSGLKCCRVWPLALPEPRFALHLQWTVQCSSPLHFRVDMCTALFLYRKFTCLLVKQSYRTLYRLRCAESSSGSVQQQNSRRMPIGRKERQAARSLNPLRVCVKIKILCTVYIFIFLLWIRKLFSSILKSNFYKVHITNTFPSVNIILISQVFR